jgi:hypothetical protein
MCNAEMPWRRNEGQENQTSTELFSWPGPIHEWKCLSFLPESGRVGRVRVSEHRVGYGGRSKFCFWAGTWGRDMGTSPGFRSPRVTEDPARKPKVRPNFFLDRDQFIGWKWISFVPESGRVGYESRSTGWGTGIGRSFVSGQGHEVGIWGRPRDFGPNWVRDKLSDFF